MFTIRLVLFTLIALLVPAVALAAEASPGVTGGDLAQGAGVVATIIAIAGVASRLLMKSAPLHVWLPARAKWVPDALAAFLGVLLVGLPEVSTLLGQVEVGLMAILMGAIAAAPGHVGPDEASPVGTANKAGTVSLVLLALLLGGCGAGSLEAARAQGAITHPAASGETAAGADADRDEARCDKLDRRYVTAGTIEVVALSLTGAQGIGTVAIAASDPDKEAIEMGLGFGAVGTVAVGAGAGFVAKNAANRWAEACSQ